MSTAGTSPPASCSISSRMAESCSEKVYVFDLGSALRGHLPPDHLASKQTIALPRAAAACSKFGGKMMNSSVGSPLAVERFREVFAGSGVLRPGWPRAGG